VKAKRHLITTLFAWNDQLWALLATFLIMFVMLVVVVQTENNKTEDAEAHAGNMSIDIKWQYGLDIDVDLWFEYPGNDKANPIYYSNRDSSRGNLVKDDLGLINDNQPENYENAFIRGLKPGRYTFNVHMFANRAESFPVDVRAKIVMRKSDNSKSEVVWEGVIQLLHKGDEVTLVDFTLDHELNVRDSNTLLNSLVLRTSPNYEFIR
jgi:hypothetical protein